MSTSSRRIKILGYWMIVCVICVLLLLGFLKVARCDGYSCLVFSGKSQWKVKEVYENGSNTWRGLIDAQNYLVRLELLSHVKPEDASEFTKIRIMKMEGLFETARSPYPDLLSDTITCQNKYKPVPKTRVSTSGVNITYFTGFLNNRLQYGFCVDDQIAYKGFVALFYCNNTQQWGQIELIVKSGNVISDDEYTNLFGSISCERLLVHR